MTHHFETEHAEKYGIIPAIILRNIIWWVEKNIANHKHFYDGRTWTYNSINAWATLFPYLSKKQVRSALELLREKGVLLVGNYSGNPKEQTLWYALSDESAFVDKDVLNRALQGKGNRAPQGKDRALQGKDRALQGKSYIGTDIKPDIKPDVSVASAPDKQKLIEEKVVAFKKTTYPFIEQYGIPMLKEFCDYWAEPTINGAKLKWELEKTWKIEGRLARWHKNDEEKKAKMAKSGKSFNDLSATPTVASSPESYHQPRKAV